MNRVIKFRAWDSQRAVMTEPFGLKAFDDDYFIPDGVNLYFGDEPFCDHEVNAVRMQFTGLKDKNGKEGFEKDIVKDQNGFEWVIEFANGKFYLFTNEVDIRPDQPISELPECEIIGNVYEGKTR